jgi:hypothetical protein
MAIRNILRSFGKFFPVLVCFTKRNLATLLPLASKEEEKNFFFLQNFKYLQFFSPFQTRKGKLGSFERGQSADKIFSQRGFLFKEMMTCWKK